MQYRLSTDAVGALHEYIARRKAQPNFANARSIRNALDRARLRHASRVFPFLENPSVEDLATIKADDIRASRVFAQAATP
jgi:hypothetical protein